jgi:signal transduction histidine kinase
LAISTRLVQLLDGEIRLKSEPGKGSLFEVVLPRTLHSAA